MTMDPNAYLKSWPNGPVILKHLDVLFASCEAEGVSRDDVITKLGYHFLFLSGARAQREKAERHEAELAQLALLDETSLLEKIRKTQRLGADEAPVVEAATWEWLSRFKGIAKGGVAIVQTPEWSYLFNPLEEVTLDWWPKADLADFHVKVRGQSWPRSGGRRQPFCMTVRPDAVLGPRETPPDVQPASSEVVPS